MVHSFPAFFCVVTHIRQSSTGLSPSCVPSRTFSESFRLAHNYIPASTGANSMDSEEETKLMNEAEDLQSQLKQAGDPVDEMYSDFFFTKLKTKSTAAERIPLWIARVESFRVRFSKRFAAAAAASRQVHRLCRHLPPLLLPPPGGKCVLSGRRRRRKVRIHNQRGLSRRDAMRKHGRPRIGGGRRG